MEKPTGPIGSFFPELFKLVSRRVKNQRSCRELSVLGGGAGAATLSQETRSLRKLRVPCCRGRPGHSSRWQHQLYQQHLQW
jgi:hypothetical protein